MDVRILIFTAHHVVQREIKRTERWRYKRDAANSRERIFFFLFLYATCINEELVRSMFRGPWHLDPPENEGSSERTLNYTQSARISILIKYKYAGLPITMGGGTFCLLCGTMLGTSAWMFPSTRKTSRMLSSPYITLITRILFFLSRYPDVADVSLRARQPRNISLIANSIHLFDTGYFISNYNFRIYWNYLLKTEAADALIIISISLRD